jgi:hypothetical protein
MRQGHVIRTTMAAAHLALLAAAACGTPPGLEEPSPPPPEVEPAAGQGSQENGEETLLTEVAQADLEDQLEILGSAEALTAILNEAIASKDGSKLESVLSRASVEAVGRYAPLYAKKASAMQGFAGFVASKVESFELASVTLAPAAVLLVHSLQGKGAAPQASFRQEVATVDEGKGHVLDLTPGLIERLALLETPGEKSTKLSSKLHVPPGSCSDAFPQGDLEEPSKTSQGGVTVISSEERYHARCAGASGIEWSKKRLVGVSEDRLVNAGGFAIESVVRKGTAIVVSVKGEDICVGPAMPTGFEFWLVIPAGVEPVRLEHEVVGGKDCPKGLA